MLAVVFWLFMGVLVLAPLPLGSNREWSWSLLAISTAGLTVLWALAGLVQPRKVSTGLPVGLVVLFLLVCGWALVQVDPGTSAGWHHPLWSLSAEASGANEVTGAALGSDANAGTAAGATAGSGSGGTISLAPDDGWVALMRLLGYGLAFFLAFQLCRDAGRAKNLFTVLVGIGVFGALYGLFSFWGGQDTFLFFWELPHRRSVHGTFVNRNHFATWMGLCLLCAVALFYQAMAVKRRNPAYQVPVQREVRLEEFLAKAWKYLAVLIVMTAALILSNSRGGFLAVVAGGLTLILALNSRQRIGTTKSRAVLGATVLVVLASFFITNEVLLERFDQSSTGMDGRLQAFELTSEGIEDNPMLGFGYGTFASSFRLYRDEALSGFYDKTHNTYLENVFELGWPAALALFACIAWAALICFKGLRNRGRDWVYPATGLAATVLVAIHALVDFSLQIPATATTYAALMGACCAQSLSSRRV